MPKDFLLSTDSFNKPKVIEGDEAISSLLVRLILLEPGFNPNRPEMGVGLISRFRYINKDSISKLKNDIKEQVMKYMPNFQTVSVEVAFEKTDIDDKHIIIDITADDVTYRYRTIDQANQGIGLSSLI